MGFSSQPTFVDPETLTRIRMNREYMETSLREAARLLKRRLQSVRDDNQPCPFHHDERPSAHIHLDQPRNGKPGPFLLTCHAGCNWNRTNPQNPCRSGDAIAVLQEARRQAGHPLDFQGACAWLVRAVQQPASPGGPAAVQPPAKQAGPDADELAEVRANMEIAHQLLMDNKAFLDRLWETRAIDAETARKLGLGYGNNSFGRRCWWFPIRDESGQIVVVKTHADDGGNPKSMWLPKNAKVGDPLFPVCLDGDGPIWIAPGELKASALISLGFAAIGITSGEKSNGLSAEVLAALKALIGTRPSGFPIDNDKTGSAWGAAGQRQLAEAGIDARIVDFGLTEEGADIGDLLVELRVRQNLGADDVRKRLLDAFESALRSLPPEMSESMPPVTPTVAPSVTPSTTPPVTSLVIPPATPPVPASVAVQSEQTTVLPTVHRLGAIWADQRTWRPVVRIATGIDALDDVLNGGFMAGGVHLIAGKAGNAKTQLAVQIATNVARRGVPAAFVSLEMDYAAISRLVLAQLAEVPRRLIDDGLQAIGESAPAVACIKNAMQRFWRIPLDIVDGDDLDDGFNRQTFEELVQRGVRESGWRVVFLDHIGELAPTRMEFATDTISIEKANISVMRKVAKRHGIVAVAVAPLRKGASYKDAAEGRFNLDDVMGSAALGYAILTCTGVTARRAKSGGQDEVRLWMLKNRMGVTPSEPIKLPWNAGQGRIG